MSDVLADRLKEALLRSGMSQSELARRVNISQAAVQKLTSGNGQGSKFMHRIAAELGTTPEYLLGETDLADAPAVTDRRRSYRTEKIEPDDAVELDQVDFRYGLGGTYMDGPVSVERRRFPRDWLRMIAPLSSPEYLFWAIGDGDSMEPTIRSGEVILIDRSNLTPRMGEGIWALAWGDIGMVKRVRPRPDGSIELLSDNNSVPPIVANDEEVHVIGRVVAVVRRL